MTKPTITSKDWLAHTSTFGHKRSAELQALDRAILAWEARGAQDPTQLGKVAAALAAWKRTQGTGDEWKRSTRNKQGYVELLTTLVEQGEDSDRAWGEVPDFMHPDLVHSRLGVLYLFKGVSVNPKLFSVLLEGGLAISGSVVSFAGASDGLAKAGASNLGTATPTVMVVGQPLIDGAWSATQTAVIKPEQQRQLGAFGETVRNWFKEFVSGLISELRSKFRCELLASATFGITNTICSAVLSAVAAGVVSGAIDTTKGAIITANAVLNRWRAWKSGAGVEFVSGHPTVMVDSIKRGMNMSIAEGLFKMLKGAANIGLAFGTAGAGLIVGIIVAAAEMIAKIIYRLYEVTHMRKFFEKCAEHWDRRSATDSIHTQPFKFGSFYRKYVLNTPALAVLTLNSGVCGHKMSFLSMFRDTGSPITSAEFLAGAKHLDSLKVWGVDYLGSAGFSFKGTDEMTSKLIGFAKGSLDSDNGTRTFHPKNLNTRKAKVWDWVTRAAAT